MTTPAIVRVRSLSHAYGSLRVLDDVSLDVARGELLAIVGPSGCGKTTLLDILMGLTTPTAGHLEIAARRRAMVFQRPQLLPWRTVLDNAVYGLQCRGEAPDTARAAAIELLTRMRLGAHLHDHPHQLSEGMKQRVNLARALLVEPDLLLMDEPLSALDPHTRRRLQDDLLALWQQRRFTAVLVSHSLEEVAYLADRIVLLGGEPARVRRVAEVELPRPRARDPESTLAMLRVADDLARDFDDATGYPERPERP